MSITTTGVKGSAKGSATTTRTISSWTLPADADFVAAAFGADFGGDDGESLSSVTLGGNAASGIVQITHAAANYPCAAVAYWINGALPTKGSAHDGVFTASAEMDDHVVAVQAWKGVHLTAPIDGTPDTNTENDDVNATIDHDITTTVDNAFIISCAVQAGVGDVAWSAADGQTEIHDDTSGDVADFNLVFGYVDAGTAGNKVQGWTSSFGARWLTATAAIAIKPAAAGGAGTGRAVDGGLVNRAALVGRSLVHTMKRVGGLYVPDRTIYRPRLVPVAVAL